MKLIAFEARSRLFRRDSVDDKQKIGRGYGFQRFPNNSLQFQLVFSFKTHNINFRIDRNDIAAFQGRDFTRNLSEN